MPFLKFLFCTLIIFVAGRNVAVNADIIAEKSRLSKLWIGFVLVAATTSLPELFTGIGSIIFVQAPDLSIGNLFGANIYNLLKLAILDVLYRKSPLLSTVSIGQRITASFTLLPVVLVVLGIIFSGTALGNMHVFNVGIFSIAIFFSYVIMTRIIYSFEKERYKVTSFVEVVFKKGTSLKHAYINFFISGFFIVGCGIWLSYIGEEISVSMGLERGFVGSLFLGFTTSLPEISVSLAALLIGSTELAVANLLGSNLFNITIVFINDILYRKGPLLKDISLHNAFSGFVVMAMTTVVILAMVTRPKKSYFNVSWYTILLVLFFFIGVFAMYKQM